MMNIDTVTTATKDNHHQSVQALATELKISQGSIRQILMGKLVMKGVCSMWVPHFLQMDKVLARFHTCTENLMMITNEPEFLTQVITIDESWIYPYDLLLLHESSI